MDGRGEGDEIQRDTKVHMEGVDEIESTISFFFLSVYANKRCRTTDFYC